MRLTRILPALAATAVAALALAGCAGGASTETGAGDAPVIGNADAADLVLTGVDGDVTLESMPQRVVVLDYASLDTLHTLGLDGVVVGTATEMLPASLESYASTTNVGTFQEPDVEAIAGLAPDLILISGRTAAAAALPELQSIATTVNVAADNNNWLASVSERAVDLAGVYGEQDAAQAKVDEIAATAAELKTKGEAAGPGLFVTVSGGKLSAYGPGSRFGLVYQDLGITPAAEISNEDRHGQEISFEFIAEHNPSVLIVMDRDQALGQSVEGQAAEQVLDNELVNGTDAAKNGKIVYVNAADWYLVGGGLTTTASMLDEIGTVLS